jgi:hypothetical protein
MRLNRSAFIPMNALIHCPKPKPRLSERPSDPVFMCKEMRAMTRRSSDLYAPAVDVVDHRSQLCLTKKSPRK